MNTLSVILAAKKGAKVAEAAGDSNVIVYTVLGLVIVFSLLLSMDLSWSNLITGVRNDLVFESRNHSYGAFEIRRNYSKKLMLATGVALVFGGLAVGTPKIMALINPQDEKDLMKAKNSELLAELEEFNNTPPPPPPPPPPVEIPLQELTKFTPPKAEDDKQEEPPPTQTKLEDSNAGTKDQEGTKEEAPPPPPPPPPPNDDIFDAAAVQEQAEFPGGMGELMKFLSKNIKYPEMESSSGIQGKVYIEFVVGTDGSVSAVKVKRGVSDGLDKEAMRVVKMMPKWKAASNNGKNVRQRYVLPVNFKIQ